MSSKTPKSSKPAPKRAAAKKQAKVAATKLKGKAAAAGTGAKPQPQRKGMILALFVVLGLGLATQGYLLWRHNQKSKLVLTFVNVLSEPGRNQPGKFCCARDMAMTPDGNVLILEDPGVGGNLQVLTPEGQGKYFYHPAKPAEAFTEAYGVAAAPDGTVYVAEGFTGIVKVLSKELKYERQFTIPTHNVSGIAVSADGDLYICDRERSSILVVDSEGTLEKRFEGGKGGVGNPYRLNFGPDGNLYVLDFPRGMNDSPDIKVFNTKGDSVAMWSMHNFTGNPYNTIAVHPKGYVFINDNRNDASADGVHIYTLKGKLVGIAAVSTNHLILNNVSNMAIDSKSGDIFLNTNTIGRGGDRFIFSPDTVAE